MTARIPLCAKCGAKTNRTTGRVLEQWCGVKGRPRVCTCWNCNDGIPWPMVDGVGNLKAPLAPILREINSRGPGRVLTFRGVSFNDMVADCERMDAKENRK